MLHGAKASKSFSGSGFKRFLYAFTSRSPITAQFSQVQKFSTQDNSLKELTHKLNSLSIDPKENLETAQNHKSLVFSKLSCTENFEFKKTIIDSDITHYQALENNKPLSFDKALQLMKNNEHFRKVFFEELKQSHYKAYFWECPGVNVNSKHTQQFEFVLVDSPFLAHIGADNSDFAEKLNGKHVASFRNLGGDALLVAPGANTRNAQFQTLAHFSRNASLEQQHVFWKEVATQGQNQIVTQGDNGTWLSTCGLSVAWLHVRMDTRPKYYNYSPYMKVSNRQGLKPGQ